MTTDQLPAAPIVGLPRARWALALGVALISDAISVVAEVVPFVEWVVDGATVLALMGIMGWRWPMLPALVAEAIPGLAIFPSWTLVVGSMAVAERMRQPPAPPAGGAPSPGGGPPRLTQG